MALLNVEGRQFALPHFLLPWGVYVNKSLADANNIDVPDPDWTISEFTRFISNSRQDEFYGIMGDYSADQRIINTGTHDFNYSLLNHRPGAAYVNMNSEANRSLLRYLIQWAPHGVWPNWEQGRVSSEFINDNWWWGFVFFINGKLLTHTSDPFMMSDAAHPDPNHWGVAKMPDWDIYPRPSTDYVGNNIGVVLDPICIRNYAMDDGNPELNAEEEAKLRIAWEFMKFWCGDTRAWDARATQQFIDRDGNTYRSCLTDSFPVVVGPEFDRQMEIWYRPEVHQRFKDANKMPGFHYILELWERGQFWEVDDKAYPWFYDFEGSRRSIAFEWENANYEAVTGAVRADPIWLDQVYARLPGWNNAMNQRWDDEWRRVEAALNRYYPQR